MQKNDFSRAEQYREKAAMLTESIEREAWDGSWYRRAYFDDGTPLGSVRNSECMIDSISQSWAVISGMAKPARAREAMEAVQKYLVDADEGIVKLLSPPFGDGDLQPGYIKGYLPGVRENGGQYTHAAVWVVQAFTRLGMGDKAGEIFHMLNPINHTRTSIEYARYKTEPYVMAADAYAVSPHVGRGGWTWYTGAAGWLYKVGLENIAGFSKRWKTVYRAVRTRLVEVVQNNIQIQERGLQHRNKEPRRRQQRGVPYDRGRAHKQGRLCRTVA